MHIYLWRFDLRRKTWLDVVPEDSGLDAYLEILVYLIDTWQQKV